jgi:hypothetical protein
VIVGAAGRGPTKVNLSSELVDDVPPSVVTVTSTTPAAPAGVAAVIEVELFTMKLVVGALPKATATAPVKPVPVMTMEVPPAVGPDVLPRLVTVGRATYVNELPGLSVDVPPRVLTETFTLPEPPGETTVRAVSLR